MSQSSDVHKEKTIQHKLMMNSGTIVYYRKRTEILESQKDARDGDRFNK